jgi:hypothetical protein
MGNPIVDELERRFLSVFCDKTEQLCRDYPTIQISTWSLPRGSATSYQGHSLGIECVFPGAPSNQPDNVALEIGIMHLITNPKLCDASVGWGAGAGKVCHSTSLFDSPIPYSRTALDQIEFRLPELYEALDFALRNPPFQNEPV